jgi:hypothetical protein
MGDGIGGAVLSILANNAFELLVSHTRKDNQEQYGKVEKVIMSKIDDPEQPQYEEKTKEEKENLFHVMYNTEMKKQTH